MNFLIFDKNKLKKANVRQAYNVIVLYSEKLLGNMLIFFF